MCSLHRIVLSAAIVGGASLSFGCHLNVPQNLQDQLIAKIAPTHDQIVGH